MADAIDHPAQGLLDQLNDLTRRVVSLERAPWNDLVTSGAVFAPGDLVGGFAATRTGFLLCDGSTIADATYPALGAYIRANLPAAYVVDGTHVKLPDYRGANLTGADGVTFVLGTEVGVETVTLTSAQSGIPAHTHAAPTITVNSTTPGATGAAGAHNHGPSGGGAFATTTFTAQVASGASFAAVNSSTGTTDTVADHTHASAAHSHTASSSTIAANGAANAASAHTNVQPSLPANIFIKT